MTRLRAIWHILLGHSVAYRVQFQGHAMAFQYYDPESQRSLYCLECRMEALGSTPLVAPIGDTHGFD